jgi:hypothetical protein
VFDRRFINSANYARETQTLLGNSEFQGLSATRQTELLNGMRTHGSAQAYLGSMDNNSLLSLAEQSDEPRARSALQATMGTGGLSSAENTQVARIQSATFTPGAGLTLNGSTADKATALHMVRRTMLNSPSFRTTMNTLKHKKAHPVTLNVGRSQASTFVDSFNSGGNQTIDLDDIQQWPTTPPAGHPEAMTQDQNIVHALVEARQGALGNGYSPSHRSAITAENSYRSDIGQTQNLRMPPNDTTSSGGNVTFQYSGGYRETIATSGSRITGITRH